MSAVDQAKNATQFIEDKTHEARFDELIWMLRQKRDEAASQVPEWEQLCDLASAIKEHTLSNLGHQTKFPKKEAMIVAGKLLSHPEAYRIAAQSTEIALKALPRFAIYNHFNAWGRHRDVPAPADETFHEWYRKHRST